MYCSIFVQMNSIYQLGLFLDYRFDYFQFEYSSANEDMDEMRRNNTDPTASDDEEHVSIHFFHGI